MNRNSCIKLLVSPAREFFRMLNPRLRSLDGLRVIAEYFVVRHHVVEGKEGWGGSSPMGVDIMSFFFVLSGFVTMWMFHDADTGTWEARYRFLRGRVERFLPMYVINWGLGLPSAIYLTLHYGCALHAVCPVLQLAGLDVWFGCGFIYLSNATSWYVSTLFWLWACWALVKDRLLLWLEDANSAWERVYALGLLWLWLPVIMWSLDIYTVSPFPLARLGEFLVGCGVACLLLLHRDRDPPVWLKDGRYWYPVIGVILLYNIQQQRHGMSFLCLGERPQQEGCGVWRWPQPRLEQSPPCMTVLEKLVNKYALVWAGLIYGVAREELEGKEEGWTQRVLKSDVLQFLSTFSFTLYLAHLNVSAVMKDVAWALLGWEYGDWGNDTLLFCTYLACYGLHRGVKYALEPAAPDNKEEEEAARLTTGGTTCSP